MVFVAPDREAEILPARPVANHQHSIEWPEHAKATRSQERERQLCKVMSEAKSMEDLLQSMLRPPLYQTAYQRGFGTLYTAVYTPMEDAVQLIWPSYRWRQTIDDFQEGSHTVSFAARPPEAGVRRAVVPK